MKVIQLKSEENRAVVEIPGVKSEVSTVLLEEVRVGNYVIVHAGFAIQVLDEEAAEETLSMIREIVEGPDR